MPDLKHFVVVRAPQLQSSKEFKGSMVSAKAPATVIDATIARCSCVNIQPLTSSSAGALPGSVEHFSHAPAFSSGQNGNLCGIGCIVKE